VSIVEALKEFLQMRPKFEKRVNVKERATHLAEKRRGEEKLGGAVSRRQDGSRNKPLFWLLLLGSVNA
jgi:hypothetical protein